MPDAGNLKPILAAALAINDVLSVANNGNLNAGNILPATCAHFSPFRICVSSVSICGSSLPRRPKALPDVRAIITPQHADASEVRVSFRNRTVERRCERDDIRDALPRRDEPAFGVLRDFVPPHVAIEFP